MPYAEYATIDAARRGVQVTMHRVPLDKRVLRSAAQASKNPLAAMMVAQYT